MVHPMVSWRDNEAKTTQNCDQRCFKMQDNLLGDFHDSNRFTFPNVTTEIHLKFSSKIVTRWIQKHFSSFVLGK